MARARTWPPKRVRLVREPIGFGSFTEVHVAGRENEGLVEEVRGHASTQRWRLTWPTLRSREITSWPM
jgi:hypothetical protein